jgi:hypothetical protein
MANRVNNMQIQNEKLSGKVKQMEANQNRQVVDLYTGAKNAK